MKKSVFIIAALLTSGCMVFAQTSNVKKASSALYQDPVDYDGAHAAIAAAKEDPTTAEDPKTWYVAGRIGYTRANNEWNKRYLNQTPDADVLYDGLSEMYDNYIKADAFDGKEVDKKGNPKFTQRKNIKGDFKEMLIVYYAAGVTLLQNRSFDKSYTMLSEYNAIVDNPMFEAKDKMKIDSTYNEVKYYAAYAALNVGKQEEALKCLTDLTKSDYKDKQGVYEQISNVYMQSGDSVKYLQSLKDGLEQYPQSQYFIGSLVNYFLGCGKYQEALDYVDQVIAKDPTNMEYMNVKAELLNQLKDFEGAKAVISSMFANGKNATNLYLMGKCWATEGSTKQTAAEDIIDNNAYNAAMAEAKNCYVEALKYFEESKSMMSKDDGNYEAMLQIMKALYMQTKGAGSPEYQAVDAELKAL
ncbi:MAG: hypothetical protein MJ003_03925 [Paludibacteraceae bacterium]|nr:hypothetical protein [Paludibacteraceae bacterium]